MWNERLDRLTDFPFRRLARLLEPLAPPSGVEPIDLALGEPKHAPPALLAETVAANAHLWNRYPPVNGTAELRRAVVAWLSRRYDLPPASLDPDRHVVTVAGTKEALFLLPQIVTPGAADGAAPVILVPNPVYSTYVGAAVMAGAEPVYLPASAGTGFLPDLDALAPDLLGRTAALYLCTPANPQGAVAALGYLRRLVRQARQHDFLLILDECYAELYYGDPPPGGLEAALAEGGSLDRVVVLHSLSKRSSAAGLRVGFVAGDPEVLARFARLRSYGGATQPIPLQAAAAALYADDTHVQGQPGALPAQIRSGRAPPRQPLRLLSPRRRLFSLARRRRRRGGGSAALEPGRRASPARRVSRHWRQWHRQSGGELHPGRHGSRGGARRSSARAVGGGARLTAAAGGRQSAMVVRPERRRRRRREEKMASRALEAQI